MSATITADLPSYYPTRRTSRPHRRGFSLIEVALSLGIAGLALVAMEQAADDASRQVKDAAVADRLGEVYTAATQYVQANPSLASSIPVGGSISVPVAQTSSSGPVPANSLQSEGYLPANFVDSNAYQQSSTVVIRQPTAGNLEALVATTGGQTIGDVDLGRIAAKVGANGGVIDSNPPPGVAAGTMLGTGGGWSEPAADWTTAGVTPTAGHALAVDYESQVNTLQDFLYRNNIGIPEANRMHTAIDMTHNALNAVGTIDNTDQSTGATGTVIIGSGVSGPNSGQVQAENGLMACEAGTSGCSLSVSSNGSFVDNHDGNISFVDPNSGGALRVTGGPNGGNNLIVDGSSYMDGPVSTYNGVEMYNGGTIKWPQTGNGTPYSEAYLAPDGNPAYLDVAGGSLSVAANIWAGNGTIYGDDVTAADVVGGAYVDASSNMASPIYYDSNNDSYYLIPSGTSNLNAVDVTSLTSSGAVSAGTTVYANASGSNGNDTEFYGQGFDVAETTNPATNVSQTDETLAGNLDVLGTATAAGLITTAAATLGTACPADGEIGKDSNSGNQDWCKSGVWSMPDAEFNTEVAAGAAWNGSIVYNTSGSPMLVTAFTENTCLSYGIALTGYVNPAGTAYVAVAQGEGFNPTITFVVPPGYQWYVADSSTADSQDLGCSTPSGQIYYSEWQ